MKQLILMRHGKAEKAFGLGSDFDRKLEERGFQDALLMAKALAKSKYLPQYLVASPAMRTKSTALVVSKELSIKNLELDTAIYDASIADILHVIRGLDDQYETAMLVGHNPSITGMVGFLTDTFIENVPTSGIVVVKFAESSWKLTNSRSGKLIWNKTPKGISLV